MANFYKEDSAIFNTEILLLFRRFFQNWHKVVVIQSEVFVLGCLT